jgi:L-lactate dehydrogenase complex protein LldG
MALAKGGCAMSDQRTLLGRIAANLRRGHEVAAHAAAAPSLPLAAAGEDRAALLARFSAEWRSLAGHVHEVATVADAARIVGNLCRARGATTLLGWSEAAIGITGLERALEAEAIAIDHGEVPRGPAARAERLQALGAIPIGLTGADALLAESGSVVLVTGPGRPRLASLLPVVHVAIVRDPRLYPSLEHLLTAEPALASAGSNLVAISGPSRTADIEMTLTRGVHGPGEVHVILLGA